MKQNRLPSQLTIEELEELAGKETLSIAAEEDIFLLFTSSFNIVPGKYRVHCTILFNLFKAWTKTPISRHTFSLHLSRFFITQNGFYYLSASSRKWINVLVAYKKAKDKRTLDIGKKKIFLERFFEGQNIRPGKLWVPAHVFHYLYKKWRATKKNEGHISYLTFVRLGKLYFEHKQTSNYGLNFRIHKSIRNLITEDELEQLRQGWERTYAKKT